MRALIIFPDYPYPINGGNKVALHGYICALKAIGFSELDLVVFDRTTPKENLRAFSKVWTMKTPAKYDLLKLLRFMLFGESYLFSRYSSIKNKKFLKAISLSGKYGCILVEHAYMAKDLPDELHDDQSVIKIISSDVLEGRALIHKTSLINNPVLRYLYSIEAKRADIEELAILENFQKVFFYGEEDLRYYRDQTGSSNGSKVSLGLDLTRYPVSPEHLDSDVKVVAFYGAFSWYPNTDALKYLLEEIWPHVVENFDNVVLKIAGRSIPEWVHSYVNQSVEFVGEVNSMQEFVSSSDVVLSPVRIGGGTRLKVLEALAWGRPVISTTIGLEGNKEKILDSVRIADTPEQFLTEIQLLLRNKELWRKCVENGLEYVRKEHDCRTNLSSSLREAGLGVQI